MYSGYGNTTSIPRESPHLAISSHVPIVIPPHPSISPAQPHPQLNPRNTSHSLCLILAPTPNTFQVVSSSIPYLSPACSDDVRVKSRAWEEVVGLNVRRLGVGGWVVVIVAK